MPITSASRRLSTATVMPNNSVLRIEKVSSQNRSWPREVVPIQYSADGGTSGGTTKLSLGG